MEGSSTKKGLIALLVAAIGAVLYFVLLKKKEIADTDSITDGWDMSKGDWTVAQRNEVLAKLKEWLDYGLAAPDRWPKTHQDAVWAINQFTDPAKLSVRFNKIDTTHQELARSLMDNGVWARFCEYRLSEVDKKPAVDLVKKIQDDWAATCAKKK